MNNVAGVRTSESPESRAVVLGALVGIAFALALLLVASPFIQ